MSPEKFEYRPKLDEEEYHIVLASLYHFLHTPKKAFTEWVYGHVKTIANVLKFDWNEEQIQSATRLVVRHWFLKGEALWKRILDRRKGRRNTEKMIKRHFGEQSYDKVLDWISVFSRYIAETSRRSRDDLLTQLQEAKRELEIQ